MNRNLNSNFAHVPHIKAPRTIFSRESDHKTSFNAGDLIPIYVDEVLPGDSVKMITKKVVRAQTLLTPIFDDMYLDVFWFFVPNRLVWTHWKELCGENNTSAWVDSNEYQVPSISSPEGGFATGTIADYMGLPVGVEWNNEAPQRPSALPFRAYALICDTFFRSEVVTDPLNIPTGDANQTGSNGSNYINDVANGGMPFRAAKFFDLFSSSVPSPQKGPAVTFGANPIVTTSMFPVVTGDRHDVTMVNDEVKPMTSVGLTGLIIGHKYNLGIDVTDTGKANVGGFISQNTGNLDSRMAFDNLYADPSEHINVSGVSFTINELRLATQLQKFYEKQSLGSRYIEVLKIHFGITSPDGRLQRPEYLGGNRVPLNISQVSNTAQSASDFLGDVGANSVTGDVHYDFEKGFTEHGILLGLACVRYSHTYSQGLERFWTRRKFDQFYWPVFQSIGYMPVYDSEIYADETTMANDSVFAYNEAWYDYRYKPNRVSGEMRPQVENTLAHWHLADDYTECPTLSDSWIREDPNPINRTLAVSSAVSNQFFGDFFFNGIWTRTVPLYSIPGLLDHF